MIEWQPLQKASGLRLLMLALALVLVLVTNGVVLSLWVPGLFTGHPRSCPDCTAAVAPKQQLSRASLLEAPIDFWPHKNRQVEQPEGRYPHVIKRMCIIGERNSGTTWFHQTLNLNFQQAAPPHLGLAFDSCFRLKHWFHFPELIGPLIQDDDLIFVVFRNLADWLLHFSAKPHQSRSHEHLPFQEFLRRPWVVANDSDACALQLDAEFSKGAPIYSTYYEDYRQVFGGPYAEGPIRDVLQLRAMKVDNFLRIPQWVPNSHQRVIYVRYEDLIDNSGQGVRDLIDEVKANFDIEGFCRANGTVPALVSTAYKKDKRRETNLTDMEMQQVHYNKSIIGTNFGNAESLRAFLDGVDFELESKLGYTYDYLQSPQV